MKKFAENILCLDPYPPHQRSTSHNTLTKTLFTSRKTVETRGWLQSNLQTTAMLDRELASYNEDLCLASFVV